ncbi:MAG: hypothetical protein UT56_C0024G0009 [Candidatus Levybacteria bacterium GW2011_GWB1_39_7]|nr:MAG: hypothetical protein UT56_C0024G0009 [Candidatus Levybacteria bacterium GW2011_GWB1_39_7]
MAENTTTEKYSDDVVNLVVARIEGFPSGVSVSIGGKADGQEGYKVENLIKHIKAQDEIGKKIIDIQLAYLRSFKAPPEYAVSNH